MGLILQAEELKMKRQHQNGANKEQKVHYMQLTCMQSLYLYEHNLYSFAIQGVNIFLIPSALL